MIPTSERQKKAKQSTRQVHTLNSQQNMQMTSNIAFLESRATELLEDLGGQYDLS